MSWLLLTLWSQLFLPVQPALGESMKLEPWLSEQPILVLTFLTYERGDLYTAAFSIRDEHLSLVDHTKLELSLTGDARIRFDRFPRTQSIFAVYSRKHLRSFLVANPFAHPLKSFPTAWPTNQCVWDRQVSIEVQESKYNPAFFFNDGGRIERLHFIYSDARGNSSAIFKNLCPWDRLWKVRAYKDTATNIVLTFGNGARKERIDLLTSCSRYSFTAEHVGETRQQTSVAAIHLHPSDQLWFTGASSEDPDISVGERKFGSLTLYSKKVGPAKVTLKFAACGEFFIDPKGYRPTDDENPRP
jgi:hypothetical protein